MRAMAEHRAALIAQCPAVAAPLTASEVAALPIHVTERGASGPEVLLVHGGVQGGLGGGAGTFARQEVLALQGWRLRHRRPARLRPEPFTRRRRHGGGRGMARRPVRRWRAPRRAFVGRSRGAAGGGPTPRSRAFPRPRRAGAATAAHERPGDVDQRGGHGRRGPHGRRAHGRAHTGRVRARLRAQPRSAADRRRAAQRWCAESRRGARGQPAGCGACRGAHCSGRAWPRPTTCARLPLRSREPGFRCSRSRAAGARRSTRPVRSRPDSRTDVT